MSLKLLPILMPQKNLVLPTYDCWIKVFKVAFRLTVTKIGVDEQMLCKDDSCISVNFLYNSAIVVKYVDTKIQVFQLMVHVTFCCKQQA